MPELEAELSAAIARIHAGEFRPTPSDFACAGCPALDLVCAGPRLREPRPPRRGRCLVATSQEARKRVGPKKERIGPIIERLAVEHADATIALRFAQPARAARLRDALGADDRRERQPGHREAFEKYRKPEDYLAVPQEELERDIFATGFYRQKAKVAARDDADAARGVRRRGAAALDELLRLPGVARKTANVVSAELGDPQGIVVDTHVRRLSQRLGLTKAGGSGEDRARPREARAARGLGALPAPADLARPPRLRRAPAALRGLRRRPLPVEPRTLNPMRWRSLAAIALSAVFAGRDRGGRPRRGAERGRAKPAKIVYVNVGQGDGVVMRIGGKIIVSDTGEQFPEHVDETLRALKAKQIDVAILSHAHEDHVKNTFRLIRDFGWTIKLVVMSDSAWWEGTARIAS